MRVLVAPSAFKGTLSAIAAAEALSEAVSEALPGAEPIRLPLADGGDGTCEVLVSALGGDLIPIAAMGPLGRPVDAAFGWLPGDVAIVELAAASGLRLLEEEERDPMRATTRGTGDLIAAALERRPRRVIVGVGGSATNDCGSGIAEALGVLLIDLEGKAVGPGAAGLLELAGIDVSRRAPALAEVDLTVACDVANPLLGPDGAARVFAPQKGAAEDQVETIERAHARFAEAVESDLGVRLHDMPRAGAAGGAGGGMHGLLGARLDDGFDVVAEMLGFDELLASADLLIVGEGSLDAQSLSGKAPIAASRRSLRLGVPVWAFGGRIELSAEELAGEGIEVEADLGDLTGELGLTDPAAALRTVAERMLRRSFG